MEKEQQIQRCGFVTNPRCDGVFMTEGFKATWGHREFEITGGFIPHTMAHPMFWHLAREVKGGRKFEPGLYDEFLQGMSIRIIESEHGNLRLIYPDKEGRVDLPMQAPYAKQYERIDSMEDHQRKAFLHHNGLCSGALHRGG